MPQYKFAFPVFNTVLENNTESFNIADVFFYKKSTISKEFTQLESEGLKYKDNQLFAVVTVFGNIDYAKNLAYEKCSFAIDVFKICSDLYHSNFFNLKNWCFDIDNNRVTQGYSFSFCKGIGSDNSDEEFITFHADRLPTCIERKHIESLNKWNVNDFVDLYNVKYSKEKKIHKVITRACHIYSRSFSVSNKYEKVVLLCTVLDTLATNEKEGKVPQLRKYLPSLVLKCDKVKEQLILFVKYVYDVRSEYIHNAEEKELSDDNIDKLEKIVYRLILQIVRNSTKYNSIKEICCAIDKGEFVPMMNNLPDIYVPQIQYDSRNESDIRYYRHFKGGKYKMLYEGKDSETQEPVVIYQALYGEHGIWVRPKAMFFEDVERDGYSGPRFVEITEKEALG